MGWGWGGVGWGGVFFGGGGGGGGIWGIGFQPRPIEACAKPLVAFLIHLFAERARGCEASSTRWAWASMARGARGPLDPPMPGACSGAFWELRFRRRGRHRQSALVACGGVREGALQFRCDMRGRRRHTALVALPSYVYMGRARKRSASSARSAQAPLARRVRGPPK